MTEHFGDRLVEAVKAKKSILCVGLDPDIRKIPQRILEEVRAVPHECIFDPVAAAMMEFNRELLEDIKPYAVAVKPNLAFYLKYGRAGIEAYEDAIFYAKQEGFIVISDSKLNDGGDTAAAYADGAIGLVTDWDPDLNQFKAVTSTIRVDAVTVNPYIGEACLEPFVRAARANGTGIFVVAKTSFKPSSQIEERQTSDGLKVWEMVTNEVGFLSVGSAGASGYSNIGTVLGATYPNDAAKMRRWLPKHWFLVPGYGAQGGGADDAVKAANPDGLGVIVNSSRGIIYAANPAKAARAARDDLNAALARAGKTFG